MPPKNVFRGADRGKNNAPEYVKLNLEFVGLIYLCSSLLSSLVRLFIQKQFLTLYIQGYPQRIRLQRRLYGIYTVSFDIFTILCNCKRVSLFAKSVKESIKWSITITEF